MKKFIKSVLLTISLAVLTVIYSCGGDNNPKPPKGIEDSEAVVEALSKSWTPSQTPTSTSNSVIDWTGFTLNFTSNRGYTATRISDESALVWPSSGTYTFPDANDPFTILRDDGVVITLNSISETSVRLEFTIAGREDGRESGLIGNWVFVMGS